MSAMTLAFLADWPTLRPLDAWGERIWRRGVECGYPPCCATFYAATVPLLWAREPAIERYWQLVREQSSRGYVPCPRCLGLPLDTPLEAAVPPAAEVVEVLARAPALSVLVTTASGTRVTRPRAHEARR